jgi:hypothetical protein
VNKAAEEKVIVFCLPPNSIHRTQPLDKGAFSPLKWREECHEILGKNPGKVITHYHFGTIFSKAWRRAMTPSNIMAGFKITGVYPVNRFALLPRNDNEEQSLSDCTGINFIPFYTSRRTKKISLPSATTHDSYLSPNDECISTVPQDSSQTILDNPDTGLSDTVFSDISLSEDDSILDASLRDPACLPLEDTHLNSYSTSFTYPDVSNHKPTARIITSVEFRKNLEEKKQNKLLEAERKAVRKAEREAKQLVKRNNASSKKQGSYNCNVSTLSAFC